MKKNKQLTICILCIICAAIVLNSCQKQMASEGQAQELTAGQSENKVNEYQANLDVLQPTAYGNVEGLNLNPGSYISLIGRSSEKEFWKTIETGAKQAIADINKALGYEGSDAVTLTFSAPSTANSVNEQVNILDEELALYPTAIGIAIVDSNACDVQFDLVAENDIPVVAFESGSDYDGIQAMISTNNTEASQTAAAKLSHAIEDKGEILLFVHDTVSASAREREQAFLAEIAAGYPDISVVNVYYMDDLDDVKQEIIDQQKVDSGVGDEGENPEQDDDDEDTVDSISDHEALVYILEQHPDVSGCLATNAGTTQSILTALKETKKEDLQIVAFEGGSKQLESLKAGDLVGLIVENPYGMGYATVVAASRAALSLGNEAVVDCGYTWVTQDNMETESIKKMLY